MLLNEQQIIISCQKGDCADFALLYDSYVKKIYDFIYYKTYHRETAEDLCSQTFIKALENINTFDFRKGSFNSWLYRIAQNTVIDHFRTKKNELNIDDVWDLSDNSDFAFDLENKLQLEKLQKYLKNIKSSKRDIVIMRIWQQLTYKEIADITQMSEANCKMIYSRTIATLKKEMPLAICLLFLLARV